MLKGIIFDIQRNSFVDGPGVRTTVFFKGCNMHCLWCHNPESQDFKAQIMFFANKCIRCGKCKEICPNNLQKCNFCGQCELSCPTGARYICGKEMSVNEVFTEIIKDAAFYEASNGGVTFSGGECMLQIQFLEELLKLCKEHGIHTAVDTAGCIDWENFEKILPCTDLFLYDIKLYNAENHKKYVGADNSLILENIKKLSDAQKNIIVRIPVIGGVNDNSEEMQNIANFLTSLNISKVELLPYHKLGEHKFNALGLSKNIFSIPSEEKIKQFEAMFE